MFQQDMIMRMIEQATKVLMAATGMRKGGLFFDAIEIIDEAFQEYFGFGPDYLSEISMSELYGHILEGDKFGPDEWIIIGDLLEEQALSYAAKGDADRAHDLEQKALLVLVSVLKIPNAVVPLNVFNRISELEENLNQNQKTISASILLLELARYYQQQKQYATSLSHLQTLAESSPLSATQAKDACLCLDQIAQADSDLLSQQQVETSYIQALKQQFLS